MSVTDNVWVLRDLSNGDGADDRAIPTYIWVYDNVTEAWRRFHSHENDPTKAHLSDVEFWPRGIVEALYEDCKAITGHYWVRRDR